MLRGSTLESIASSTCSGGVFKKDKVLLPMQNRSAGNRLGYVLCLHLHITYHIVGVVVYLT